MSRKLNRSATPKAASHSVAHLAGPRETAHLLSPPKNADRLFRAITRAERGLLKPQSVESLRRELGLERRK